MVETLAAPQLAASNPDILCPGAKVYSTCPPSYGQKDFKRYKKSVVRAAQWSEDAGCEGMLIYTDNQMVDPWLIAQLVIENTFHLSPLVALQPIYMHPFSAAKMVSSLSALYQRRVDLNLVAGGFRNDLIALNDPTPHDARYERLAEYAKVMLDLLSRHSPTTFDGRFYQVRNLTLQPALAPELMPQVLMSGSSAAGLNSARAIGAIPVQYPEPPEHYAASPESRAEGKPLGGRGLRIGIIARADEEEAWRVALDRFPEDRQGQITHKLALKVSDSVWHQRLAELGESAAQESSVNMAGRNPYWLGPYENYKTFCPYLVGNYESVAHALSGYLSAGYDSFILDIPALEEEFDHMRTAFQMAAREVAR
ncbi:MAG TPA: LLM class flavin-dependent oxidoreductase [Bryobacteraceae bacterium]|jgi:alkanesulfonate monooxygenase|nr:LLM class flavin-dependent oxidoreductase [Bryobacteraceae bacterium]